MNKTNDLKLNVYSFASESLIIEGIYDNRLIKSHAKRLLALLDVDKLTVDIICEFYDNGQLRDKIGMNVTIGNNTPMHGGVAVRYALGAILLDVNNEHNPFQSHTEFELLHPFVDGNGRTGRAIWLWQMIRQHGYNFELSFLHQWYYQSLDNARF